MLGVILECPYYSHLRDAKAVAAGTQQAAGKKARADPKQKTEIELSMKEVETIKVRYTKIRTGVHCAQTFGLSFLLLVNQ